MKNLPVGMCQSNYSFPKWISINNLSLEFMTIEEQSNFEINSLMEEIIFKMANFFTQVSDSCINQINR